MNDECCLQVDELANSMFNDIKRKDLVQALVDFDCKLQTLFAEKYTCGDSPIAKRAWYCIAYSMNVNTYMRKGNPPMVHEYVKWMLTRNHKFKFTRKEIQDVHQLAQDLRCCIACKARTRHYDTKCNAGPRRISLKLYYCHLVKTKQLYKYLDRLPPSQQQLLIDEEFIRTQILFECDNPLFMY